MEESIEGQHERILDVVPISTVVNNNDRIQGYTIKTTRHEYKLVKDALHPYASVVGVYCAENITKLKGALLEEIWVVPSFLTLAQITQMENNGDFFWRSLVKRYGRWIVGWQEDKNVWKKAISVVDIKTSTGTFMLIWYDFDTYRSLDVEINVKVTKTARKKWWKWW